MRAWIRQSGARSSVAIARSPVFHSSTRKRRPIARSASSDMALSSCSVTTRIAQLRRNFPRWERGGTRQRRFARTADPPLPPLVRPVPEEGREQRLAAGATVPDEDRGGGSHGEGAAGRLVGGAVLEASLDAARLPGVDQDPRDGQTAPHP